MKPIKRGIEVWVLATAPMVTSLAWTYEGLSGGKGAVFQSCKQLTNDVQVKMP